MLGDACRPPSATFRLHWTPHPTKGSHGLVPPSQSILQSELACNPLPSYCLDFQTTMNSLPASSMLAPLPTALWPYCHHPHPHLTALPTLPLPYKPRTGLVLLRWRERTLGIPAAHLGHPLWWSEAPSPYPHASRFPTFKWTVSKPNMTNSQLPSSQDLPYGSIPTSP